jgi:ribose transport system permease protein
MNAPAPIEAPEPTNGRRLSKPSGAAAVTDARRWLRLLLTNEFGLAALIVVFGAIFALGTPGFGSSFNLFTLGRTMAIDIVIGFSMMVVIVTGGLNLSVGAIGVCSAMAFGWLLERAGVPIALGVAGALALGGMLGAVNGILIVRSGLHSFIITLATMSIFFGMMVFISRAEAFRTLPPEISAFGKMRFAGYVSPLLLASLSIGSLLAILYRLTRLGREMLAAGAKPAAAELSGVRVGRTFVLCHVLSGVLAGIAALMVVARTGASIPSMAGDLGQDWLLPAFLGPVLGGTILAGGRVSVLGSFLGSAMVSELTNGLLQYRVGEFWVQTWLGLLLLLAVLMDLGRRTFLTRMGA